MATTYFVTQSGAGSANGSTLGNAWSVANFNTAGNWSSTPGTSGKISPGDTVTLNGTFTGSLNTQGDGASGNVITINFASGAKFSASPYSGTAITVKNNYLTVDGVDNTQVRFESLANGTGLASQVDCTFVVVLSAHDVTVKNCKCGPHYIRTIGPEQNQYGTAIFVNSSSANCNNFTADNNVFSNMFNGIVTNWGNGASGVTITNNNLSYQNWGIGIGDRGNAGDSLTGVLVKGNNVSQWANWDDTSLANNNHHNGVFLVWNNGTGTVDGAVIANNFFGANTGGTMSGQVHSNGNVTNLYVINNVFAPGLGDSIGNAACYVWGLYATTTISIYNNTFVQPYGAGGTAGALLQNSYSTSTNFIFRNNLMTGPLFAFVNWFPYTGGVNTRNHNSYYAGGSTLNFGGPGGNDPLSTWQGWGYDLDAITTDPKLVGSGNYQIQASSPAVGTGTNLTSLGIAALNKDALGNNRPATGPWDIGAYEYGAGGGGGITFTALTSTTLHL